MRNVALVWLAFALLSITGCAKSMTSGGKDNSTKLKAMLSRTDVVLVKHFYEDKAVAEGVQQTTAIHVIPGGVSIQPIWVYEPGEERSGEKGASVSVASWSYFDPETGRQQGLEEATAYLDLDELRDLSNALDYFASSGSPWRAKEGDGHVEVAFDSKDQFHLSIFHATQGDVLYAEIGAATATLSTAKIGELRGIVQGAIDTLAKQ